MLGFSIDQDGAQLFMHADLDGVQALLTHLRRLEKDLLNDECPHEHLFSVDWGENGELTNHKLVVADGETTQVMHLKMYGWNTEWKARNFPDEK